jgi:hypothetical protein
MRLFQTALNVSVIGLAASLSSFAASANLLRATWNSQVVQNKRADADDLSRMKDAAMVRRFAQAGLVDRVPSRTKYYYTRYIPAQCSYLRPWSKLFLDRISRQYHARFKKKMRVTSLIRTVAFQNSLQKRNGNAASSYGPRRSSHLTGATLDISKNGMRQAEIDWMRGVLHSLREKGHIYAVEEFSQPTFHIMVYKSYPKYVAKLQAKQGRNSGDDD